MAFCKGRHLHGIVGDESGLDVETFEEVLLFPQMRPEVKAKTAESDNAEQIQS